MFPIRDHNPSGRRPYVTLTLIAVNIAVFALSYPLASDYQLAQFYHRWGLVPGDLLAGYRPEVLLTHMFVHGGWMHLIGNLLFLWIFGDNLEDEMGAIPFLLFYLATGLAAAALQILPDPRSMVPMVGASGAIAGVMGGYLLLFPRARVDVLLIFVVFFKVFSLPAWAVLGVWFALQLVAGLAMPNAEEGIAYFAHIGGFVAGLVLVVPLWARRGGSGYWAKTGGKPPHPGAQYRLSKTAVPKIRRR